jgi:hypothetical protein
MTKQASKGYLLPEVMPTEYRCYQVFVPDCPEAVAAFWGSLDYLSKWMAWERDDLHRGKDMAALFYTGVQLARDQQDWGCGVLTSVRQHPDYPCLLQYSEDDGETWITFADILLCPVLPGAPTDDGEALSTDVLWVLWNIFDVVRVSLDGGGTVAQAAQMGAEQSLQWLGRHYLVVWRAIAQAMSEHSPAERASAMDYDEWEPLHAAGWCDARDEDPEDDYKHWLDVWADGLMEWLNEAAGWLWVALNTTAETLLNAVNLASAGYAGNGEGAGFGWSTPACPGRWDWYFEGSDPPYTIIQGYEGPGGNPGNCLRGVDVPPSYNAEMKVDVVAEGQLTQITLDYYHSWGTPNYVGVGVFAYASGGALKYSEYQVLYPASGVWTGWGRYGLEWDLVAGDYIKVFVSNSGVYSGIDNRLDNVSIWGSEGLFAYE